jgi:hypothetical protein
MVGINTGRRIALVANKNIRRHIRNFMDNLINKPVRPDGFTVSTSATVTISATRQRPEPATAIGVLERFFTEMLNG